MASVMGIRLARQGEAQPDREHPAQCAGASEDPAG